MSFMLLIYNYQKYNGKYNKLRLYWKEETRHTRISKGFLVVNSLILPWIPLILMGYYCEIEQQIKVRRLDIEEELKR